MCDITDNDRSAYACPACHRALLLTERAVFCDNEQCESVAAGKPHEAGNERDSYLMLRGAVVFEKTLNHEKS